jgi:hypothetical protein
LFDSFLALVALHFTPLAADELENLFFAPCPDGFLGSLGRYPEAAFSSVRATRVRDVLLPFDFAQTHSTCRHEQAFEVGFEDGGILRNTATRTA